MISFFSRNNQQSHIINIVLASFARSVRHVKDPRFFLHCFQSPRASRLGHKRKEKSSVHNLPYGPRTRLIRGMYRILQALKGVWQLLLLIITRRDHRSMQRVRPLYKTWGIGCNRSNATSLASNIKWSALISSIPLNGPSEYIGRVSQLRMQREGKQLNRVNYIIYTLFCPLQK